MSFTPESWNLEGLIALGNQYWYSCTLHAGVQLGIFSALQDRCILADEIAQSLGTDARATEILLNALVTLGLLQYDQGKYRNTEVGRRYLVQNSTEYCGYILQHHANLVAPWSQLAEAVRTGKPTRVRKEGNFVASEQENFLMGMFNMGMGVAPKLAKQVSLGECRHLLDLGGGPGTYAIQLCLHNPQLTATVFDLPTTQPFAEKTIARFGLSDRIRFVAGDYLRDSIPDGYDVVLLSHILHAEGEAQCEKLLGQVVEKLAPLGQILIHDFFLDENKTQPTFPALFSLNMLVNTQSGRSYSEIEVRTMLEKCGIEDIITLPLNLPSQSKILLGKK